MRTYRFFTLAAVMVSVLAFADPAGALIMTTYDLNVGMYSPDVGTPKTQFDSGKIGFAPPQILTPQNNMLELFIVFNDDQALKVTDMGADDPAGLDEQVLSVKLFAAGDPTVNGVIELPAKIEVLLTGVQGQLKGGNPVMEGAVCTVSNDSTECAILALGFGDFTDGMLSFHDIHFKLTVDAFVDPNSMQAVNGLTFNAFQFVVGGDKVAQVGVPEPASMILLGIGLVAFSLRESRRTWGRR